MATDQQPGDTASDEELDSAAQAGSAVESGACYTRRPAREPQMKSFKSVRPDAFRIENSFVKIL